MAGKASQKLCIGCTSPFLHEVQAEAADVAGMAIHHQRKCGRGGGGACSMMMAPRPARSCMQPFGIWSRAGTGDSSCRTGRRTWRWKRRCRRGTCNKSLLCGHGITSSDTSVRKLNQSTCRAASASAKTEIWRCPIWQVVLPIRLGPCSTCNGSETSQQWMLTAHGIASLLRP